MGYKTRGGQEKQDELLGVLTSLEPSAIQAVLLERAKHAALAMAVALLEQDVETLGGRRYERKPTGLGYRGGHEQTSVVVDGAKYGIRRPRVWKHDREIELPTLGKLQNQDLPDEQMRQRLVLDVSMRNYEQVINHYSEKLGVSRSSVSHAFVRASQKDLDGINEGKLDGLSFVGLMLDSLEIGGRTILRWGSQQRGKSSWSGCVRATRRRVKS